MKLPIQSSAVMREPSGVPTKLCTPLQPELLPAECQTGTSCCPSKSNCTACCDNTMQLCLGGHCVNGD